MGWAFLALALTTGWIGFRDSGKAAWSQRVWWAALGGALICFRWPLIWLPQELYPDEGQLLAGAITLRHDPIYWRAVDMGTAGPLDAYVLLPAAFFPGVTAYAVGRLIGALLVWGTLVAVGETLAAVSGFALTRLAALPAFLFLTFTTSPEYIHHSTELVANFLLALAGLAAAWHGRQPARRHHLWLAGLLLGAVPWAKLQLAPLAGGFGLFLVARELAAGRRREIPLLIAAALLPTLLVLVVVTASGTMEHLVVPFVLGNLLYVNTGRQDLLLVARQQGEQVMTNGYQAVWLIGAAVFCASTAVVGRWRITPAVRKLGLGALAALGLAAFCILAPGRPYAHYLVLLLIPVTLLIGTAMAAWSSMAAASPGRWPRAGLILFGVALVVPLLALRISRRPDPYAYYNLVATAPTPEHHQLIAKIRSLSHPGEALGLWGWRSSLYVGDRPAPGHAPGPSVGAPARRTDAGLLSAHLLRKDGGVRAAGFCRRHRAGKFLFHDAQMGPRTLSPDPRLGPGQLHPGGRSRPRPGVRAQRPRRDSGALELRHDFKGC